jgi:hypothetical protein
MACFDVGQQKSLNQFAIDKTEKSVSNAYRHEYKRALSESTNPMTSIPEYHRVKR